MRVPNLVTLWGISHLRKMTIHWEYLGSVLSSSIVIAWQNLIRPSVRLSMLGTPFQSQSEKQWRRFALILFHKVSNSICVGEIKNFRHIFMCYLRHVWRCACKRGPLARRKWPHLGLNCSVGVEFPKNSGHENCVVIIFPNKL